MELGQHDGKHRQEDERTEYGDEQLDGNDVVSVFL
jgi:hypothetical protein